MYESGAYVATHVDPVTDDQRQPNGVDLTLDAVERQVAPGRIGTDGKTVGERETVETTDGEYHLSPGAYVARYGETIRIPLDELAYEQRIGTDFFGTKPEASPESASGSQDPTPEGAEAAGGTETSAIDGDVEVTAVPSPGTVTNGNGTVVPGVGSEGTATPTNSTDDDGLLDRDRGPVQ